jgi:Heat-labile enterotoxin alpha chain
MQEEMAGQQMSREAAAVALQRYQEAQNSQQFQSNFNAWKQRDGREVLSVLAAGPEGAAVALAAEASPIIALGASVYGAWNGAENIDQGHPVLGSIELGLSAVGLGGSARGIFQALQSETPVLSLALNTSSDVVQNVQALTSDGKIVSSVVVDSSSTDSALASTVFRGERSSVTPDDVFANGIFPKGDNMDLLAHVSANQSDSGYVSTSPLFNIAQSFAGRNGYIYDIVPAGGIDVNATLGVSSPFPEQYEIAIPRGVSPANVRGAYSLSKGQLTGEYITNPNFGK